MSQSEQKLVEYLNEAHATETGLVRVLQSQIAMAPPGGYRRALERHLEETRLHAEEVEQRVRELGGANNLLQSGIGLMESLLGQTLALWKAPLDLVRGESAEAKVLKNAKDACATEALEIATYTALEQLARALGDEETADLANSIRADEERMLDAVQRELPRLAAAVVGAEVVDEPEAAETNGMPRPPDDLPIADYDDLTEEEIVELLEELSATDLAAIDAHERMRANRTAILTRIGALREEATTGA